MSGIRVRFPKLGPSDSSHFPSQAKSGHPVARELGCQSQRLGCQPLRLGCQSRRLGCQSRRRYCGRSRFLSQVSRSDSPAEVCLDCLSLRLRVDLHLFSGVAIAFPAETASWLMLVFHATRNPGGGGGTGSIDTGGVGEKGGAAWAVAEEEC